MNSEPIVALVGRRDEPTDGVADYCTWLGGAIGGFGYRPEIVRLDWPERGWNATLANLREMAAAWRGRWVLLQYTTLAWSRRGFPLQAPRILSVLRKSGARCGVVFHDFGPFIGGGVVGRLREHCHIHVLEKLYGLAESAIFPVPLEKVSWLPSSHEKAVYIPVGANCPDTPPDIPARAAAANTVAVFCVTLGRHMTTEVRDISYALKRARTVVAPLRLLVLGRGSREADAALRAELAGTEDVEVETLGLLSPEEVSRTLARAHVMLFVRSEISSRRGSAIAGIATGLPVVGYVGPETGWPITEAGLVPVPLGDREALSVALQNVLSNPALRASLAERSRRAQEQHFSWRAIAARYADVLGKSAKESPVGVAVEHVTAARTR
jgi:glycosyltransferase involved in cell wall biosynthesis